MAALRSHRARRLTAAALRWHRQPPFPSRPARPDAEYKRNSDSAGGSTINAGSLNVYAGSIAYATDFSPTAIGNNSSALTLYASSSDGSLTVTSPITAGSTPLNTTFYGYYGNTITISNNIATHNGNLTIDSNGSGSVVESAGTTINTGTNSVTMSGQPRIDIEGAINAQYIYFQTAAGGSFTQGANATIDSGAGQLVVAADNVQPDRRGRVDHRLV